MFKLPFSIIIWKEICEKRGGNEVTCKEIIDELKKLSFEKYRENVIKLGIPEESSIGVNTGDIRKLAKSLPKTNELAFELWQTGYHEAKLLAVLLFDKKKIALEQAAELITDVHSWDLCDHLCKNLLLKLPGYQELIFKWYLSEGTYYKRAAFTLIALAAIHEKELSEETIEKYLQLISDNSSDGREHVKKAVSWALREIGKRDFDCQEKAVLLAHELKDSTNKVQVWIGKDALKEIENLVKVEGRERLISANSKMGKGN